ncbi:MAG: hypothetical protein HN742_27060 [Lentisphaerae bacterium]|jgi:hypothetical protein|nr:hypothetical protein [Lentisphaerota bacterium]MBT4814057.1 hypothetical protein [Lentisphaerota bacterium]MBT5607840.1 hypothetical protein [Lentisphaerota bacterium]MBT7054822.1 hypothetical protein [Lentisphaerota bacterium]MBT7845562.1 hypothetical protein [Lentisphaerota bacterium]
MREYSKSLALSQDRLSRCLSGVELCARVPENHSLAVRDFHAICQRYGASILLCPFSTPAMEAAMEGCQERGYPFRVADRHSPDLSIEGLREFYLAQGLHCWCDTDDVVYASAHYLAIYAAVPGLKRLRLGTPRRVTPLLAPGVPFTGDRIPLALDAFETRLFRLD